uniref:Efflux RND transporter periplasmic adaptor subunit n=1 Tax=candidate division WOR-3 bacterium TaxID=2052148 RepID=A0A7C4GHQ7_UNCW3
MKQPRMLLIPALCVALAVGCGPGRREKKTTRPAPAVEVATVRLDTVLRTVQLLGTIQGEEQALALPKFAGRVTEIARPEGSWVSEGEPILYVLNDIPGMDYKPGPVRAPVSGVIGRIYVEIGQTVGPTTPVAAVSRFSDRVKVKAPVSDRDIGFVKVGAQARVAVAGVSDGEVEGRVTQASPIVDPLSRAAMVEVTIPNRGGRLVPGMSASVRLTLERRSDVPTIPLSALFADGRSRVVVVENGIARVREVTTGLVGDELVEVKSGLNAGETVVTTGKERIRDGDAVTPVQGESR